MLFGLAQPLDDSTGTCAAGITRENLTPHRWLARQCIVALLPLDDRRILGHECLRDAFAQLRVQHLVIELAVACERPEVMGAVLSLRCEQMRDPGCDALGLVTVRQCG